MRCGNGGWSGFIDAYGTVRNVLYDENGSIFFRGGGIYTVSHFEDWMKQQSFYTRHGDWFVGFCAVLVLVAVGGSIRRVSIFGRSNLCPKPQGPNGKYSR
ncbi:MAG: hypothetical protein ACPGSB_11660, partial [Opitutales bacterium]